MSSFMSTGDSVYEDATEGERTDAEAPEDSDSDSSVELPSLNRDGTCHRAKRL